jgi:hypothetical protein
VVDEELLPGDDSRGVRGVDMVDIVLSMDDNRSADGGVV